MLKSFSPLSFFLFAYLKKHNHIIRKICDLFFAEDIGLGKYIIFIQMLFFLRGSFRKCCMLLKIIS